MRQSRLAVEQLSAVLKEAESKRGEIRRARGICTRPSAVRKPNRGGLAVGEARRLEPPEEGNPRLNPTGAGEAFGAG